MMKISKEQEVIVVKYGIKSIVLLGFLIVLRVG